MLEEVKQALVPIQEQVLDLDVVKTEEFQTKYMELLATLDALDAVKAEVNEHIKCLLNARYLETGETSVKTEELSFTFIPTGFRETLDTKRIKAEAPDIYEKYKVVSMVSPSLRLTKKKHKEKAQ